MPLVDTSNPEQEPNAMPATIKPAVNTKVLNTGLMVLAHDNGDAKTFANRTQAENAAAGLRAHGIECWVPAKYSNPFYVAVLNIHADGE
jgi:hypothetical protein